MGELRTQLEAEQKRMEMREMDDRGQSSRLQQKNRCGRVAASRRRKEKDGHKFCKFLAAYALNFTPICSKETPSGHWDLMVMDEYALRFWAI